MSEYQDIVEVVEQVICETCLKAVGLNKCLSRTQPDVCWFCETRAKKLLSLQVGNLGVAVIEKESELPEYKSGRAVDTWIAVERTWYKAAQQDMKLAGWHKVVLPEE